MARYYPRQDEYDVDFEDTRDHAVLRWKEMLNAASNNLSSQVDRETMHEARDWRDVAEDIHTKATNQVYSAQIRRILMGIQPLPRTLFNLTDAFERALAPYSIEFDMIWGLLYLNVKLAMNSQEELKRTADWLSRLRRTGERFLGCYRICNEKQESTLAMIDFFDHTILIMCDSAKYLRRSLKSDDNPAWQQLEDSIRLHQKELDDLIRHLTEISTYSAAMLPVRIDNLTFRHSILPEPEERATFPLTMLPYKKNENFYGRREELLKMDTYLKWEGNQALRTFSIYGRRGVGKTQIALEYACQNPSRFDAIFWVGCESTLSLRQSFTNMALKLSLPGADSKGHHEENLLNVKKWLKNTKKRWLLVFDNADKESETILRGYWPLGANGSILITSRYYYNFMKDIHRKGETIKPFNEKESWALLVRLMADAWANAERSGQLRPADYQAARDWLSRLGGLPLSIQQAASLITNPKVTTSFNIAETYARFLLSERTLPTRYPADRSRMVRNLDALFDMVFKELSRHSRSLLSVLSLLSPDDTLIRLFLPRRQSVLDGKLAFAKQEFPQHIDEQTQEEAVTRIVATSPALVAALDELRTAKLIHWDHEVISVHRVVQEAMNYYSIEDLQSSFDAAVRIVNEAFPKQTHGNTLYEEWPMCAEYVTDAVHLSRKFSEYQQSNSKARIDGSEEFTRLLSNVSWYLYEIGDYDLSRKVIDVAKGVEANKESHLFSHLCNTQGANYYDLNRVVDCRRNWEMVLRIREKLKMELELGDVAISLHNMGNLETSTGNYDKALAFYQRAVDLRLAIGDRSALQLGTTYLGIGRCHAANKNFAQARQYFAQAEQLFVRTLGADKYFMADCHYAYGNIEFEEKMYSLARRSFENCLSIASAELPIHPITVAAYYSLGCVEFEMGNADRALGFLAKARNIAELRSPGRDDGTVARVLWKTGMVLKNQQNGTTLQEANEAEQLLARAYIARSHLISIGEGGEGELYELDRRDAMTEMELEEESFDLLIPGHFR